MVGSLVGSLKICYCLLNLNLGLANFIGINMLLF